MRPNFGRIHVAPGYAYRMPMCTAAITLAHQTRFYVTDEPYTVGNFYTEAPAGVGLRGFADILRRLEWDALRIERAERNQELVGTKADSAQARELQGEIARLSVRMSMLMDRTTGGPGARKGADE